MPAWAGSSEIAWFRWGGVALVAVGVGFGAAALIVVAVACIASGGALLLLERVEVRVDDHGVQVRNRYGWPRVHLPLEEIEAATELDVRPSRVAALRARLTRPG